MPATYLLVAKESSHKSRMNTSCHTLSREDGGGTLCADVL